MIILTSLILLSAAVIASQGVPTSTRCEARHKDLLQEAVSVRKECGGMEVFDCCAVSLHCYLT